MAAKIYIPNWLKLLLKILLSGAALVLVIYKIDFQKISTIVISSDWWWLIPAALFFVASKILSSIRLNGYFLDIGIRMSEADNLRLYWLGMFYNLFLPGGIGGDGYKIVLLGRRSEVGTKKIFQAVLLDRLTGLIALVFFSTLTTLFLPIDLWLKVLIITTSPLINWIFYIIIHKYFPVFVQSFTKANLLSAAVQLAQLVSVLFILFALKIGNAFGLYFFIFLISSVIATIPFTVGGVGAREITFLYASTWLGLDTETAVAVSFIFFAITAIISLYGIRFNLQSGFGKSLSIK
ncbi:MAG: flippase-like domain-containing protein [Bacteroidales bacterium]|nr:flippase-like domain-containing protein [Bacteroidales bacterium]